LAGDAGGDDDPDRPGRRRELGVFLTTRTEGAGAKIYPVEQELESLVRKADFQTLYFRKWEHKEGKPEKEGETLFDPGMGLFFYRDFRPFQGACVDTLSFIHLLRLAPSALRGPPRAYDRGKFYRLAFEDGGSRSSSSMAAPTGPARWSRK